MKTTANKSAKQTNVTLHISTIKGVTTGYTIWPSHQTPYFSGMLHTAAGFGNAAAAEKAAKAYAKKHNYKIVNTSVATRKQYA